MIFPDSHNITVYTDEVGRGSLIYDVTAAAVIMPFSYDDDDDYRVHRIKDSKKCSHKQLIELDAYIRDVAIAYGIGSASVEEIDKYNILNASMIAMHRALDKVYQQVAFDTIIVDGNRFKVYMAPDTAEFVPHQCIVNADSTHLGAAAASIIAKVHRDTCIQELVKENEEYATKYHWNTNMGYGTREHMEALKTFGPTKYHRMSFKPVAQAATNT